MDNLTSIIVAVFASTGFWGLCQFFVQRYFDRKSAVKAALLGLLHERLVEQCEVYMKRGYVSEGEYRDLEDYIYKPYRNLGGNGTGEAMMEKTRELIFRRKDRAEK